MEQTIITGVPPEVLPNVWVDVAPLLQRAIDYNGGVFDLIDVKESLFSGDMILLAGSNGGDVKSAFVLERVIYPRMEGIRVVLAAGEPLKDWLQPLVDLLDSWIQADPNATFYELIGRPGWRKALKGIAHETATIIRRTVA